jgi:hypothetical protein
MYIRFPTNMVNPIINIEPTAPDRATRITFGFVTQKLATVDAVNKPVTDAPVISITHPVAIPVAVDIAAGAPPTGIK